MRFRWVEPVFQHRLALRSRGQPPHDDTLAIGILRIVYRWAMGRRDGPETSTKRLKKATQPVWPGKEFGGGRLGIGRFKTAQGPPGAHP